jgi:hypothetical protein
MPQGYVYNALSRDTFEVLAYNAVGRASEVNLRAAYALQHSTGNSGWSVGIMQWDFGQPGRGAAAEEMLQRYADWAEPAQRFSQAEQADLLRRLQTRGQVGNDLTSGELDRLNGFLRSDDGRTYVQQLNDQQVERKWEAVGQPLSQVEWLQDLNRDHPEEAAKIVAMASKLYNQNQIRGGLLLENLQQSDGMTADGVRDWISDQGINGLNPAARAAIVSGRDATLRGVELVNALEQGQGAAGREWRDQVRAASNTALAEGFSRSASLQLYDAMLRDPVTGMRVLSRMDERAPGAALTIAGNDALAREEISRVRVDREGSLTVTSPSGEVHTWNGQSWSEALNQADPRYHQGAHSFGPPAPLVQESSALPPVFTQCLEHVHALDRNLGRVPDERSDRVAACLATEAMANGIARVDHVVLSDATPSQRAGHYLFAVQGALNDPAHLRAHVATEAALQVPVEASLQRASTIQQEQMSQQESLVREETQARTGPALG